MISVIKRFAPSSLPAVLTAGSFISLLILMLATNPVDNIAFAMIFFLVLLIFLASLGYLLISRWRGGVTPRNRFRIFIISIFLVVVIMFRSAQSLGWLDSIVLVLVTTGLLFYSGRRV